MKRIAMLLLVAVPCVQALTWTTNKVERGKGFVSWLVEKEPVRGIARPLRRAEQHWEIVWPSGPESNLVRALRLSLSEAADVSFSEAGPGSPASDADDFRSFMIHRTDVFDAEFRDSIKHDPGSSPRHGSFVTAGPTFISPRIISLRSEVAGYTGGAHGWAIITHAVHDVSTGRTLPLGEIIPASRQTILCGLLERQFRADRGLTATEPLTEGGLFEDRMSITGNYTCTADGLMFTYGLYEIAPYSAGIIEIRLPWADVRGLLGTGTAVRAEAEARTGRR